MKKYSIILITLFILSACKDDSKSAKSTIPDTQDKPKTQKVEKSQEPEIATETGEQIKDVIVDFNTVLNKGSESKSNTNQAVDKAEIERRYQLSNIPKEEYQEKLNNPDTLKKLIKHVEKHIKDAKSRRGLQLKGEISHEQLTSKNTATGISIEEAILVLQDDLKGKITPEKLKKIDSLSGTTIISKLPEKDARKVLQYVKVKEIKQIRPISMKAGYMHDAKEADQKV